ncbi:Heat shock protein 17 [Glycine soja]
MGSSSTYAAVVYFSSCGKVNPELGGQHMELRLVEYFADEFNAQVGGGIDVRHFPKAMATLKKQVKRRKEMLSANTVAPISVESLDDGVDFGSTMNREKFEDLCQDIWDKSLLPVKEVLQHSGLSLDLIYALQLIGGATRVPKLQAQLQQFLGRKQLDRHLDADEAIVLGSAPHAANLSDGIKLKSKLGILDASMYGFVVELSAPDLSKDESSRQLLVPQMKKVPNAIIEITERVEVPRKNMTIENSTISSNVSAESAGSNSSEENMQTDSEISKTSNGSAEEQATAAEPATEEKLKKRTFRERQSFIEKLDQVQDWLYRDGEDANATEFQELLDQLKTVGNPIFFRLKELTARPAAVEHAHRYIDELKEWKANKSWFPQEQNWLDDKEADQKKTSGFRKPAFISEAVYSKVLDLQNKAFYPASTLLKETWEGVKGIICGVGL